MVRSALFGPVARVAALLVLATLISFFQLPARLAAEENEEPTPTPTPMPMRAPTLAPAPTAGGQPAAIQATPSATPPAAEATPSPTPVPTPPIYPLAVMVDNFPSARPQTGLAAADIVYEALAEGGITRFLAIYTSDNPGLVGPVRSTRHYYVYWAAEYNAPLMHILASDLGYAALVNTGLPDLDEHRGDPGFMRSDDRRPPYNAYTSPSFDRQVLAQNGALWPGSLGGLARIPPPRISRGVRTLRAEIVYPLARYTVDWTYDRARHRYLRSQAGAPHTDAISGEQISAATVIAQFVPAWEFEIKGGEAYVDMQLRGTGRAVYFQGGLAVEGIWNRITYGNHTDYYGPDGKPMSFRPGPIWIQIVPTGPLEGSLSYSRSPTALLCPPERGEAPWPWLCGPLEAGEDAF